MSNEQPRFCQSCSMPLIGDEECGTGADGAKSADYCRYCYSDGEFTTDIDLDGMVGMCLQPMLEAHPEMSREEAETMLRTHLPQLKRWR